MFNWTMGFSEARQFPMEILLPPTGKIVYAWTTPPPFVSIASPHVYCINFILSVQLLWVSKSKNIFYHSIPITRLQSMAKRRNITISIVFQYCWHQPSWDHFTDFLFEFGALSMISIHDCIVSAIDSTRGIEIVLLITIQVRFLNKVKWNEHRKSPSDWAKSAQFTIQWTNIRKWHLLRYHHHHIEIPQTRTDLHT